MKIETDEYKKYIPVSNNLEGIFNKYWTLNTMPTQKTREYLYKVLKDNGYAVVDYDGGTGRAIGIVVPIKGNEKIERVRELFKELGLFIDGSNEKEFYQIDPWEPYEDPRITGFVVCVEENCVAKMQGKERTESINKGYMPYSGRIINLFDDELYNDEVCSLETEIRFLSESLKRLEVLI